MTNVLVVDGPGGLPQAVIENHYGQIVVALQGAQVLSYVPRGGTDLLWVSSQAQYAAGRALRGGIPLCWPWFGPHPTDSTKPAHGIVRTRMWEVRGASIHPDGARSVVFGLTDDEATRALWPYHFDISLTIALGTRLTVALTHHNTDDAHVTVGGALHTYLPVSDISAASVEGLDGREYLDQLETMARHTQRGTVTFNGEVDRIYVNTEDICVLRDQVTGLRTQIAKSNSRTTVVWNPWVEKARRLSDFGADDYRRMVCVETANAADDVRTLAPGAAHTLAATIWQE